MKRLWEVCQIPDYSKVAPSFHAELVSTLYKFIMSDEGAIPEDWFGAQVDHADWTEGDIDNFPTASPISAPGPSCPTGANGSRTPIIGKPRRARSRTSFPTRCTSN